MKTAHCESGLFLFGFQVDSNEYRVRLTRVIGT